MSNTFNTRGGRYCCFVCTQAKLFITKGAFLILLLSCCVHGVCFCQPPGICLVKSRLRTGHVCVWGAGMCQGWTAVYQTDCLPLVANTHIAAYLLVLFHHCSPYRTVLTVIIRFSVFTVCMLYSNCYLSLSLQIQFNFDFRKPLWWKQYWLIYHDVVVMIMKGQEHLFLSYCVTECLGHLIFH